MNDDQTSDSIADDARISAWLDGELDPPARAELEARFAAEPAWSRARDETASVRDLVRALEVVEPPAGFLESLVAPDVGASVVDIDSARRRTRRSTGVMTILAVAAALLIAVVVPDLTRAKPALATDVRLHQAGVAASGDPVSGLAPLGASMRLGR
ncbi:MAG: hypothetical protein ABJC79_01180 [Acidimicrobiia bacterium]